MAYDSTIGDSQPVAKQPLVTCFPVSYVPVADIADIASDVNDSMVSGKALGSMILAQGAAGVWTLYVANGSAPADTWGPVDGGAVVTPA